MIPFHLVLLGGLGLHGGVLGLALHRGRLGGGTLAAISEGTHGAAVQSLWRTSVGRLDNVHVFVNLSGGRLDERGHHKPLDTLRARRRRVRPIVHEVVALSRNEIKRVDDGRRGHLLAGALRELVPELGEDGVAGAFRDEDGDNGGLALVFGGTRLMDKLDLHREGEATETVLRVGTELNTDELILDIVASKERALGGEELDGVAVVHELDAALTVVKLQGLHRLVRRRFLLGVDD